MQGLTPAAAGAKTCFVIVQCTLFKYSLCNTFDYLSEETTEIRLCYAISKE